jgi:hypothetical protein
MGYPVRRPVADRRRALFCSLRVGGASPEGDAKDPDDLSVCTARVGSAARFADFDAMFRAQQ